MEFDAILLRQDAYRTLFLKKEVLKLKWYQRLALRLLPEKYRILTLEDLTWEGRTVIRDLIRFCNMNNSDFDTDTHIMAFQCGKREVLQRVLANLHIDLSDVVNVTEEENSND